MLERASELSAQYDRWIENDAGDGHKRAPGIHASELSCARRVVYSIVDFPKSRGLRKAWRQRFQTGHAVHAMLQRDFKKMAADSGGLMRFEDEVPISPKHQVIARELNIWSHCDGVFSFLDDPFGPVVLRVGLEIKTESPDGYAKLYAPKPEHVTQAHVYMKCLDLPAMWFLYFNKGNQNNTPSTKPFLITFDEAIWDKIEKKCNLALNYAAAYEETKELPDREEGFHCEFCPYSYDCKPSALGRRSENRVIVRRGL